MRKEKICAIAPVVQGGGELFSSMGSIMKWAVSALVTAAALTFAVLLVSASPAFAESSAQGMNVSPVETDRISFEAIGVAWKPAKQADGYEVTATQKQTSEQEKITVEDGHKVNYNELPLNRKYKFSVRAYTVKNGRRVYGEETESGYISTGYVKKSAATGSTLSVKWNSVTGSTGYSVTAVDSKGELAAEQSSRKTSVKLTGLKPATKYTVTVTAAAEDGGVTASASANMKTRSEEYIWPVSGRILSRFGYRTGVGSHYHQGIDINCRMGTPIAAAKDGVVTSAGWSGGYGYCVVIRHDGGTSTLYAHLSLIGVKKGQKVTQGTVIGKSGQTGTATCPHLHFGLFSGRTLVDPLPYLPEL